MNHTLTMSGFANDCLSFCFWGREMHINYDRLNINNRYLDEVGLWEMIAQCAYCKSEQRRKLGVDGDALQDWLEAEQEVNKRYFYWIQPD